MRITKEKKLENHDRIVAIASELFRERGFDGVGLADLMARAGLTHGGFYNHFASKDALVAEASAKGLGDSAQRFAALGMTEAIDLYISRAHRDARGQGCAMAALSGDAARMPEETKSVFGDGIEGVIGLLATNIARTQGSKVDARREAVGVLAQAVGAIVLSRACPDTSALADEILDICRAKCRTAVTEGQ
jgi:TetR/AcrR family transcriptional regulator, transcriptional repressor for nem operon